ncbi:tetratricopeptide repeat protein 7A isoform X1 [Arachis ipaensis]|uniref:tetratricopeptide repeat protein 7A isoform X1 n=1 Tax=Arachis ipaensis TaxID=130454 RepID=UPI0007AF3D17|nr:tetratricopeptide repeat protein 7A isoform X1 [Arachis ipaensis]XP_025667827.1 tetratricopeptide repeat protein 7A isoform X1 [Arachis hypogaea]
MKVSWKKTTKKKRCLEALPQFTDLPFEHNQDEHPLYPQPHPERQLAKEFQAQGDKLALLNECRFPGCCGWSSSSADSTVGSVIYTQHLELQCDGKYREALGKWESALTLTPDLSVLHEQKAQVLLEIGDAWNALKAATRATELEPSWAEAWLTLGRAQLNFGEPDNAIESFDSALALKPDFEEAQDDRKTALHLVKKRKQLHSSDTSTRYVVGNKGESS